MKKIISAVAVLMLLASPVHANSLTEWWDDWFGDDVTNIEQTSTQQQIQGDIISGDTNIGDTVIGDTQVNQGSLSVTTADELLIKNFGELTDGMAASTRVMAQTLNALGQQVAENNRKTNEILQQLVEKEPTVHIKNAEDTPLKIEHSNSLDVNLTEETLEQLKETLDGIAVAVKDLELEASVANTNQIDIGSLDTDNLVTEVVNELNNMGYSGAGTGGASGTTTPVLETLLSVDNVVQGSTHNFVSTYTNLAGLQAEFEFLRIAVGAHHNVAGLEEDWYTNDIPLEALKVDDRLVLNDTGNVVAVDITTTTDVNISIGGVYANDLGKLRIYGIKAQSEVISSSATTATDNYTRAGRLYSTNDALQTFTFDTPFVGTDGTVDANIVVTINREIEGQSIPMGAVNSTLTGFSINRDNAIDGVGTTEPFTYIAVNTNALAQTYIPLSALTVNDQTASGYFDEGTNRRQWGSDVSSAGATKTITFAQPMGDTNYHVSPIVTDITSSRSISIGNKTTTSFDIRIYQTNNFNIEAIPFDYRIEGLKP